MPVAELMERMSAREFDDWRTYAQLEPFGEERADWRMGILASVIANANRDDKKHPNPFEPKDFMPDFAAEPEKPMTDKQLATIALFEANAAKARDEQT
jgi:hypothetical protein